MTAINPPVVTFTGGLIGKILHNRVDVPQYPTTAEIMENCEPYAQGPLTRSPGTGYVDEFTDSTKQGKLVPFVFSTSQSYMLKATSEGFDFYINDGLVETTLVTTAMEDTSFTENTTDRVQAATITASATGTGSVANLKDSTTSTVWGNDATNDAYLDFDLGAAYRIRDIWLSADTTNHAKMPTAMVVYGSNTGSFAGEETTLLTLTDPQNNNWTSGARRKYELTTQGSFRYYRLYMSDKDGSFGANPEFVISKVALYDSPWMDDSDGNSSVTVLGGLLYIDGDGGNNAIAVQRVPIVSPNTNKRHILIVDIEHGPVSCRVGSTIADNDVAEWSNLDTGIHYLDFTPAFSAVYVAFYHSANAGRILNSVSILSGTTQFRIPHGYAEADLYELHRQQIGDVLYITHPDYEPRRLIRRGHRSWSFSKLRPNDGPFGDLNTTALTLTPSGVSGEITVTASDSHFANSDVGVLYSMTGSGQVRELVVASDNLFSAGVKVTGVGSAARSFNFDITGTFSGTIRLQRSSGNENSYTNWQSYTSATNVNLNDTLDNQTWYYRIAVLPGEWTSGTAEATITYSGGSSTGVFRIVSVASGTSATAEVLSPLSGTDALTTWKRGAWNATDGWPVSVSRGFGRLWFGRGIRIWGSVSDNFTSFETGEAESTSIQVQLANPSSEGIRFISFLTHLVIGTKTSEYIGVGNTDSDPVSPTNFQTIETSYEGSSTLMPVSSDGSVLYVHRNLRKLMQYTQNPKALSDKSYISVDLNRLSPELLWAGVRSIAIQREPEHRIYVVLKNGVLMKLLFRREEDVVAWSSRKTDGFFEDVEIVQQDDEDSVYFIVKRQDGNGNWKRYIEKQMPETVKTDEDWVHLDSSLSYDLERPNAIATPSGTTGTITVTTDVAAFDSGDVTKVLWINGGRGEITGYTSSTQVTVDVWTDLLDDGSAGPGLWGFQAETTTLTGLDHLNGIECRVYGDAQDLGTYTPSSGSVTLARSVSVAHVGRAFRSRWKSAKLSYGAQKGTALTMPKAIKSIGLLLYRMGTGFKFGPTFSVLRPLITRKASDPLGEPTPLYSGEKFEAFDARYGEDSRLCFQWDGCAPGTVAGYVPLIDERDR